MAKKKLAVGDEVMAPWGNDGFLYPAVVVQATGEVVHVAFLDGDEGDVAADTVTPGFEFATGASISVNWKGRGRYYEGVIKQRAGRAYFFQYEDGDQGWATIAQCRIPKATARA